MVKMSSEFFTMLLYLTTTSKLTFCIERNRLKKCLDGEKRDSTWTIYKDLIPDLSPEYILDVFEVQGQGYCWTRCIRSGEQCTVSVVHDASACVLLNVTGDVFVQENAATNMMVEESLTTMKSLDTPQEETQTQQTAESSCTGGFSQFGNWSHGCYMLGSHGRYNQALSSCTSAGGEMAVFETVEEFLAVTSSLSVDVWTSGRPSTWDNGVWEFNGQVISDIPEMWDPYPPPDGNILFHRAVFSASTRKLFSASILSSYTALCERY